MRRHREPPAGLIVGAYAASPAHSLWRPALEAEFYEGLAALAAVRGLELPWTTGLHPHDDGWLLRNLPRRFDLVLTSIPGTAARVSRDPEFGLASCSPLGRAAAVTETKRMRDGVHRLTDAVGRGAVIAVELHSAPSAGNGTAAALAESLEELAELDWDGARLVIEHCDAARDGRHAEKGFLELAAIEQFDDIGICLNWGRSVIELRNPDEVTRQIANAASTGRLAGLMFSGAASVASPYGAAWADAHLPIAPSERFPDGEPSSLLTEPLIADALDAARTELTWLGFKFGWQPPDAPVLERVAMIANAARMIDEMVHDSASAGKSQSPA